MPLKSLLVATLLFACATLRCAVGDDFAKAIVPFSQKYCLECHSEIKPRGGLDLTAYKSEADVTGDFRRWSNVIEFVRNGEMPPADHPSQPTLEERAAVAATVERILQAEARKHAGDPGVVPPRRLSNTEFDAAIEDLTGVNIRPTKDFPVDPAGGEGFDNTGESLRMSPSLLRKYLQASQQVANHLVLKPHGISFAPFPVTSNNERRKLTEQAVIDFYRRHDPNIERYIEVAWRYPYRAHELRETSLDAWANLHGLSPKYLELARTTLAEASNSTGFLKSIGDLWHAIPPPADERDMPRELQTLIDCVTFYRRALGNLEGELIKAHAGNWPIEHLDFRAKKAAMRDQFDGSSLQTRTVIRFDRIHKEKPPKSLFLRIDAALEGAKVNRLIIKRPAFSKEGQPPRNGEDERNHAVAYLYDLLKQHAPETVEKLPFGSHPQQIVMQDTLVLEAPAVIEIPLTTEMLSQIDGKHLLLPCELDLQSDRQATLLVRWSSEAPPKTNDWRDVELLAYGGSDAAKTLVEPAMKFSNCFPNRFVYVDDDRGLEAGFHLVEGFFRDDVPLVQKVLSEPQKAELDNLWTDLHFVTASSESLIRGFVWFERSERHVLQDQRFDFLRSEDPQLISDEMLARFERAYLEKMNIQLVGDTLEPVESDHRYRMVHGFFQQIREGLKRQKETLATAEATAKGELEQLAQRAYSRPLRADELESLRKFYDSLREQGASVEESLRGIFQVVLMSPNFCYRYVDKAEGTGIAPLSNEALATRLSYFLWSSLPDDELLIAARDGKLRIDEGLRAQTRRMLKDVRARRFAREFLGQWLRYRDFLSTPPNTKAFPEDSQALRDAMFEEPARLAAYLVEQDAPVTELLASDQTFVNGVLAKHYGGAIQRQFETQWNADPGKPASPNDAWYRVEGLKASGRGGLFGMSVILAKNSAGERTSPVKRGFWTVHRLLGQHFPPPPADVPELPKNEKEATQTIRQLLAQHAADAKCAMCHVHFDGFGLAMEGFDPLGRARTVDLGGRTIDDTAPLPKDETAKGIPQLINYIARHRQRDFVKTLCRKFLGYALGRSVELSDQPLLDDMEAALEKENYRFSILFEKVVTSPQFKNQRGQDYVQAD
jgi:hypothetical protein